MASKASLDNELRKSILDTIAEALGEAFDTEVLVTGTGELVIPVVDAEGNEKYGKIKVSIPRGTRDGDGGYIPYNGYDAATDYADEKASKEQERAVKKAMKEAEKGKKPTPDEAEEE